GGVHQTEVRLVPVRRRYRPRPRQAGLARCPSRDHRRGSRTGPEDTRGAGGVRHAAAPRAPPHTHKPDPPPRARAPAPHSPPTIPSAPPNWKRTCAKGGDHPYYTLPCQAIANTREPIYLEEQFFQAMAPAPKRTNPTGGSSPKLRSDLPDLPDTIERLLADRV